MQRFPFTSSVLRLTALCMMSAFTTLVPGQQSLFQYLDSVQEVKLAITTDWDALHAIKDDSYQDAELELDGKTWEIEVRLRGVYRRKYCDFPPFQINFKKKIGLNDKNALGSG